MKFPRNARIFRGQLDAAPFAAVFLLLVTFVLLHSIVYTPGVRVQLPEAGALPGIDRPTIAVAVDATVVTNATNGSLETLTRFYFANENVTEEQLKTHLLAAVKNAREPLTLVVQMDKSVSEEELIRLAVLARNSGIQDMLLATLPRAYSSSATPASGPP